MPSNEMLQPDEHVPAAEAPHSPIPLGLRWLTWLLLLPLLALATAFFGSISLIAGLWDSSGRQQHFIARTWARFLLRLTLSPVTLDFGAVCTWRTVAESAAIKRGETRWAPLQRCFRSERSHCVGAFAGQITQAKRCGRRGRGK